MYRSKNFCNNSTQYKQYKLTLQTTNMQQAASGYITFKHLVLIFSFYYVYMVCLHVEPQLVKCYYKLPPLRQSTILMLVTISQVLKVLYLIRLKFQNDQIILLLCIYVDDVEYVRITHGFVVESITQFTTRCQVFIPVGTANIDKQYLQ